MKKKTLLFIVCAPLFLMFFLSAQTTSAASLLFSSSVPDGHVGLQQMFKVSVKLDPEGAVINSLDLRISYPHDLLKLSGIEDGSSFISMWLERAHEEGGTINLAGIVPRGFGGNITDLDSSKLGAGDVVTLIFEPIKAGSAVVGVSSGTTLLNDGLGTETPLKYGSTVISIGDYENSVAITSEDVTPPDFIYAESHYDATLGGQYLFFLASDKESGIDHYEVKNGDVWQTIQSPYLINQNGGVYYIKAIDRAGNERIKEVRMPTSSVFSSDIFWLVVVLGVLLLILAGKSLLARKQKKL